MFSSLISAVTARQMKSKALINYKIIVKKIKNAADKGESGCFVDDIQFNYEINQRLHEDGFDTSTNLKQDGKTWIFWG